VPEGPSVDFQNTGPAPTIFEMWKGHFRVRPLIELAPAGIVYAWRSGELFRRAVPESCQSR
jgi:hypothetical protein